MVEFTIGQQNEARKAVRDLRSKRADMRLKRDPLKQPAWGALTQAQKIDALRDYLMEVGARVDDLISCEIHELRDLLD